MKKVLIVDDHQDILDLLVSEITAALGAVTCVQETDFTAAVGRIRTEKPDAVVLDLRQGAASSNLPGQATWKAIWDGRFCPVIVYTAGDGELDPPVPADHPFIKLVIKGTGTERAVIAHLQAFFPHVAAINQLREELELAVQRALCETGGAGVISGDDSAHLVHAVRRRIAALMDKATATEARPLFSWEQYLIPAFGDSPRTGDLLRKRGSAWQDAPAYRLILTPTCDLVGGRNEATVLVAKCAGSEAMTRTMSLPTQVGKAAERVRVQALAPGFINGFLPLPEFPGRIPLLTACLKDLEVLQYDKIGLPAVGNPDYERIASIDSPFREQVSWAFLNTVARPGMPDRDLSLWATALATANTTPAPVSGT